MSLTLVEIDRRIEEQITRIQGAMANGDAATLASAREAFQQLKAQRADALLRVGEEVAAGVDAATAPVAAAAARIADPLALFGVDGLAERAGLPVAPASPAVDRPEPPPEGPPEVFVAARATAPLQRVYVDSLGREFLRSGGSRSWRNNNPGNIRRGDFARNAGAIGDDGAFAIFPDVETGFQAIVGLLRSRNYVERTLREAIFRYAPPAENDATSYVDFVTARTGLAPDRPLADMRVAEIRKVATAIQAMEGWASGDEHAHLPASRGGAAGGASSAAGAALQWLAIARREAALPARERSEWSERGVHNPRIIEYFRVGCSFAASSDEVHWCAAFVNFCLESSGHLGTGHPGARSFHWNKKSQFVRHATPLWGAVGVRRYAPFDDPAWSQGAGHVGFVVGFTDTTVTLLGGNQGNTVSEREYPLETSVDGDLRSKFVAFMMPVMN